MPDLPSSIALATINDGTEIEAAPHRNNYAAVQTAVNALIAALAGGSVGKVFRATDSDTVEWGDDVILAELGADPTAPSANGLRLYAKDDGSGNTGLYVRFADGSVYKILADGGGSDIAAAPPKPFYVGQPYNSTGGFTWTANAALLVPFDLPVAATIDRVHFRVITQSGNYDVGIYSEAGTRLVSKGSTAMPAAGIVEATFTSTPLAAGRYYLAIAIDNGTAQLAPQPGSIVQKYLRQVASSFPLPSSITPGSTPPTDAVALSAPVA